MFIFKTRTLYVLVHLILVCLLCDGSANDERLNMREKEVQVLDGMLGNGKYDSRIRPSGSNGTGEFAPNDIISIDSPVVVRVNMLVKSISKVDDANMEFSVQLIFREQWMDERLKYDDIGGNLKYLSLTEPNRIWTPDLFFSEEKESHFHNTLVPNVYVRIFPNGSVLYSKRISLTVACPMNFELYPFDRQYCPMRIASYGSKSVDVVLLWKDEYAVQGTRYSELQMFTMENLSSDYCSSKLNSEYSCLSANFLFKRNLLYHLIHVYIPCCILVFASWISFWLNQEAVTARALLSVTTLLTILIKVSNINASLPPVSYIKAIDIWNGVCLAFIFGALLEVAFLNLVLSSDMKKKCEQTDVAANLFYSESDKTMKTWIYHSKYWLSKLSRAQKIDIISRFTFPLLFALFNLAYWIIYLRCSDDY